ncbi:MAG: transposase [Victivallaceae bacterium]|jgi:transposase-like protein
MKKNYDSKFKSRVALEAIQGMRSIAEIASEHNIHPNLVGQWKRKLLLDSADIFATKAERQQENKYSEDELMCKIGQLEVENDFLRKKYNNLLLKPEKR